MDKALLPGLPPLSVFDANTQIRIDGHPPDDFMLKARIEKWTGRLLLGSACRIEDVWDAVEGYYGAVAVLTPPASAAARITVEMGAGDLQQEIKRMFAAAGSSSPKEHGFSVQGEWSDGIWRLKSWPYCFRRAEGAGASPNRSRSG